MSREVWEQPTALGSALRCFIWLLIRMIPLYLRDRDAIHDVFQPKAQEVFGQISSGDPSSTAQEHLIISVVSFLQYLWSLPLSWGCKCGSAMFTGLQHFIQHMDDIPQAFRPCLDMFWEMMNPSTVSEHDVVLQAAAWLQPPPKHSPVRLAKEASELCFNFDVFLCLLKFGLRT